MYKRLTLFEFLRRRGYDVPLRLTNVLWRWFFVSFTQTPFGGFWRVWNPFFGFYLAKLYRRVGGDKNRLVACILTFAVCGLFHDMMSLTMDSPHRMRLKATFAFSIFGVIVAATSPRPIQRILRKSPRLVNVILNVGFITVSYFIAHLAWRAIEQNLIP